MSTELVAADLAARIKDEHEQAVRCAERALDHARRAGELLIEAKSKVKHGDWRNFIRDNDLGLKVGSRQIQNYMRLAREWPSIPEEKRSAVAHLPIRDAIQYLAEATERTMRLLPQLTDEDYQSTIKRAEWDSQPFHRIAKNAIEKRQHINRENFRPKIDSTAVLDGRPVEIQRNEVKRRWALVIGPDERGVNIDELVASAKESDAYTSLIQEAEKCETRAKELERGAQRLRKQAEKQRNCAQTTVAGLVREDGPLHAFTETLIFERLPEADDEALKSLGPSELVSRLVEIGVVENHDSKGDMNWMSLSDLISVYGSEWDGIGLEAGLS